MCGCAAGHISWAEGVSALIFFGIINKAKHVALRLGNSHH